MKRSVDEWSLLYLIQYVTYCMFQHQPSTQKTGCTKLLGCDKRNTCQLATDPSGCEKCECEPVELEVVYDYYDPADYFGLQCPALNGCSKKKRKSCKYG